MNNKSKRILIENYNLLDLLENDSKSTGGACAQLHATALGLTKIGCEVNVLVTKSSDQLNNYSNYNVTEVFNKEKGVKIIRWLYYRIPRIIKIMKNNRPEIIIQECAGVNTFLYAIMAKIMNAKFVYLIANDMEVDGRILEKLNSRDWSFSYYKDYITSNIIVMMYKIGLLMSSVIICQNKYQHSFIKKKGYKKSLVLYNAFKNNNKISNCLTFDERKYIAWAGKFVYQKNLTDLYYIANNNPNLSFKIAGILGYSNVDGKTLKALDDLKLLDNISFVGQLPNEEYFSFLSKAIFLLNTSHYEGFSNTFIEAISVGTPIVTLGVNPDSILNKYKLGFVTKRENLSELIDKKISAFNYSRFNDRANLYLKEFHDYITVANKIIKTV